MNFGADPKTGGDENYLNVKEGEPAIGIFRGEPLEFFVKWENKKSVPCDEHDHGAKFRFKVNFIVKQGSEYVAKVWEQGAVVYQQLKELNVDYPLEKTIVKITRSGTGLDTSYNILPIPKNGTVNENLESMLQQVKLCNLRETIETKPTQTTRTKEDDGWGNTPPPPTLKNYAEELPF